MQLKKYPWRLLIAATVWFSAFTIYRSLLNHVLYYFEQHHLFIYTRQYISTVWRREGWEGLATDFISQFFHNPIIGAAILATLLALIYLSIDSILRSLRGSKNNAFRKVSGWLEIAQFPLIITLFVFFSFTSLEESVTTIIGVFVFCLLFAFLYALFRLGKSQGESPFNGRYTPFISAAIAVIAFVVAGVQFQKNYSIPERIMMKTQQFAEAQQWNDVLEYTAAYQRSGHNNILIAYYRSLALAETGKLEETAKDAILGNSDPSVAYLAQMGQQALFFPWKSNSRESEYGALVYEHLGLINEAQHWETEALQVFGMTAPHLLRLAKYAIVTHRPKVAEHFLEPLKHTLYYRDEAAELWAIKESGKVEDITNTLDNANDSITAPFTNVFNLMPQLEYALSVDSTNTLAHEYLNTCRLITITR